MKKLLSSCLLPVSLGVLLLGSGCVMNKPLPKTYFDQPHAIGVTADKIPPKPVMRDSGQGGLIGIIVNASRASGMREKMAGIQGETVKELLRQELNNTLQEHFEIADSSNDLILEVTVNSYGWFAPSTLAGIRTGAYQFEILGQVRVMDVKQNRKVVAGFPVMAQHSMGDKPSENVVQDALMQTVKAFSTQTGVALCREKLAPAKK